MRPLCCGMISQLCLLFLHLYLDVVACSSHILSAGSFSSLLSTTSSLAPSRLCYLKLSRGNVVYDFPKPLRLWFDVSLHEFSVARTLIPLNAAADAVTPTCLLPTAKDLYSTYFMRMSMVVPSMVVHRPPPPEKSAACIACPPYPLVVNGSGGSRPSAPASAPGFPSLRFPEHSGTGTLNPPRVPTAYTALPVGTRSLPPLRRFCGSQRYSSPLPLGRVSVTFDRK